MPEYFMLLITITIVSEFLYVILMLKNIENTRCYTIIHMPRQAMLTVASLVMSFS